MRTPLEIMVEEKIEELEKTAKMQKELNKYGKKGRARRPQSR